MKITNIQKLYVSNFLTGLVFWYGIEKLFMQSIGINAIGVGTVTIAMTIVLIVLDIPSGILADKWSRKGTLILSALSLAVSSFILGISTGLPMYIVGSLFYGLYVVATSGTYSAIMYDSLHEEGRSKLYSKINGRAYGLFLAGAGVGNIASGFLAQKYSFRTTFYLTIISCLVNVVVMASMHEPTFHKSIKKEKMLRQIGEATLVIAKLKFLRSLTIVMTLLTVVEFFKFEFGQLYMLRYVSSAQMIGILWALFAFAVAFGSLIAHRFKARINSLIVCTTIPYILMTFLDNSLSLVLFMVQAVAAAVLINQIETHIQEETPSSVRASILSVISTLGRIVAIPASLFLGWLFRNYNAFVAVKFIAIVLFLTLVYWLWTSRREPNINEPIVAQ
jgi:MFS family permease